MDYSLAPQIVTFIWLKEIQGLNKHKELIDWMLITNTPVTDIIDAVERIEWYKVRWTIECFHRILKSGCCIEECRLGDHVKLKKYLSLKSVIAWRLDVLTLLGRSEPESSCEIVLEKAEWKVLYRVTFKTKKPPRVAPRLSDAMIWIARLGGFQARKNDGHPGMTTIWRGWTKLQDMLKVYNIVGIK